LPSGSAGITGEIDGAMQHAPHDGRQSRKFSLRASLPTGQLYDSLGEE
jgi:hypothetical protein